MNLDINIYPLLSHIEIALAIILIIILLIITVFLIHNHKGLNLFSKHDNSVIKQFLEKYPLVSTEFINKTPKAQNIENNQEIHEINKRLEDQDARIKHLEMYVADANGKLNAQLDTILKEMAKKNG